MSNLNIMLRFLRENFCFTRGEMNGTLVLATMMIAVFAFPYLYNSLKGTSAYMPDPEFLLQVRSFYNEMERQCGGTVTRHESVTGHPGNIPAPQEVIAPVENAAGTQAKTAGGTGKAVADGNILKIDINTADTTELMQVRGIGPVFSTRIIRYRDILGGYVRLSQLKEVYGLDNEIYMSIEPYLLADTSRVLKLRPRTDEFSVLLRHPYLDYGQVSQIFRLRNTVGLNSPEDLLQSPLFSGSDLARLAPYLLFD
jgi:hypothetical protein